MSEIDVLKRKLERERLARLQAEQILEDKALELYLANESLRKLNETLEDTIQKRTEALRKSEEQYRAVVDQASDIIYSTDEEGYFTFINQIGIKAFGFEIDEILGKRYIDFVPEEFKAPLFEYYTQFRDEKKESDYNEFPIISKDGQLHWLGQNVNRIENVDGTFYYNAVARDISLRKKAEDELKLAQAALLKSEVKYRSALENMDLGLMEVDTQGKISRVYERFCAMTGFTQEELIGKDAIDTLLVSGYENVLRTQDESRLQGEASVYEVKIKRKNGEEIWVLISRAPFYNEQGEVIGSLGIHYDITDRKELEANLEVAKNKAEKAQQAEQQFLANMSHEIRTPLNAIIGMTHLLKDTSMSAVQLDYLNILENSASLLKNLVSDILDISKIDSGKVERIDSNFDLVELMNRMVQTFSFMAEEKGISLVADFDTNNKCYVYSDQNWISQIMMNLVSNAIKFTQNGGVRVILKHHLISNDEYQVHFEVKDTGVGLTNEEVDVVFNEFQQANKQVRDKFGGTGLGLSIASKLVEILGGKLDVKSKKNEGSSFFFTIKMKSSDVDFTNTSTTFLDTKNLEGIHALIVEDNVMNQKYISALLDKWNITYQIANHGREALDLFNNGVDIIFMDLSMPVMDGYEATKLIRQLKGGANVPIIALTASTFLSKRQLAIQSGMTDFLSKPFAPNELLEIFNKYLSSSKLEITKQDNFEFNKALDKDSLEKMFGGDFDYALVIFNTFDQIIDKEIEALNKSVESQNYDQIAKLAHKVKPMFSMVGYPELTKHCQGIEETASEGDTSILIEKVQFLKRQISNIRPIISEEIRRLTEWQKNNAK